jgi:Flp pilus assembly protein TadG
MGLMRRRYELPLPPAVRRRGAALVETALTLPVFMMFLAALLEFGHFYLVKHVVEGAARRGVHYGSFEKASNSAVESQIKSILASAFNANKATVVIKDASVFDSGSVNPSTLNYSGLPAIDLSTAEMGDYFLVQIEVPYDQVALLPPFWIKDMTIRGRALMRHE